MRVSTHAHIQTPSHEVCHTTTSCHLKGVARSISKYSANNANPAVCHTERSEVSQAESNRDISLVLNMTTDKNANVQNHLDISVSTKPQYDNVGIYAKPQYDKAIVITKETSASPCFASKSQDLRGNPQNQTHLTQKMDCHDLTLSSLSMTKNTHPKPHSCCGRGLLSSPLAKWQTPLP